MRSELDYEERIFKEMIQAYILVLSQHFPGMTEENPKKSHTR
jgi:hypothetical protein